MVTLVCGSLVLAPYHGAHAASPLLAPVSPLSRSFMGKLKSRFFIFCLSAITWSRLKWKNVPGSVSGTGVLRLVSVVFLSFFFFWSSAGETVFSSVCT